MGGSGLGDFPRQRHGSPQRVGNRVVSPARSLLQAGDPSVGGEGGVCQEAIAGPSSSGALQVLGKASHAGISSRQAFSPHATPPRTLDDSPPQHFHFLSLCRRLLLRELEGPAEGSWPRPGGLGSCLCREQGVWRAPGPPCLALV